MMSKYRTFMGLWKVIYTKGLLLGKGNVKTRISFDSKGIGISLSFPARSKGGKV